MSDNKKPTDEEIKEAASLIKAEMQDFVKYYNEIKSQLAKTEKKPVGLVVGSATEVDPAASLNKNKEVVGSTTRQSRAVPGLPGAKLEKQKLPFGNGILPGSSVFGTVAKEPKMAPAAQKVANSLPPEAKKTFVAVQSEKQQSPKMQKAKVDAGKSPEAKVSARKERNAHMDMRIDDKGGKSRFLNSAAENVKPVAKSDEKESHEEVKKLIRMIARKGKHNMKKGLMSDIAGKEAKQMGGPKSSEKKVKLPSASQQEVRALGHQAALAGRYQPSEPVSSGLELAREPKSRMSSPKSAGVSAPGKQAGSMPGIKKVK